MKNAAKPRLTLTGLFALAAALAVALLVANSYLGARVSGVLIHTEWVIWVADRVLIMLKVMGILIPATAVGLLITRRVLRLQDDDPLETLLTGAALGTGVLSVAMLVVGAAGALDRRLWIVILLVLFLSGIRETVGVARNALAALKNLSVTPFEMALVGLVLCQVLLISFSIVHPPLDYDVTEYHLGAPLKWFSEGRIGFIKGNVYSNMPFLTEMLYLLGITLEGDGIYGAYLAHGLTFAFGILSALATYCIAKRVSGKHAAVVALAFFYTMPWVFELSFKAYVEMPLVFYGLVALHLGLKTLSGEGQASRYAFAAALVTGFAMSVKYTAFAYFYPPFLVLMVIAALSKKTNLRLRGAALAGVIALVVVSPWLVKNLIATGNPFYPLLYEVFGGRDWSALKNARWVTAHASGSVALRTMAREAFGTITSHKNASLVVPLFVPFALFVKNTRRHALALLAAALWILLVWAAFTHRIGRFAVPALPLVAVVSAWGLAGLRTKTAAVAARALVVFAIITNLYAGLFAWESVRTTVFANTESGPVYRASDWRAWIHEGTVPLSRADDVFRSRYRHIAASGAILALGEANNFYAPRNMLTRTVFDGNLVDELLDQGESLQSLRDRLIERNIEWIFINWKEISRFDATYAFEFDGKRHRGFSDRVFPGCGLFARMTAEGLVEFVAGWGSGGQKPPEHNDYEIYSLRGSQQGNER